MTDISSAGPLAGSGAYPKTAEEFNKLVEEAVDKAIDAAVDKAVAKAVKSLGIAAQSRPQEAAERPASKTMIVFTGIIALAALATLQLGMFYWLDNSIRSEISGVHVELNAEISNVRGEISSVRGEISDLRSDMREDFRLLEAKFEAKFDEVWAELGDIRSELGDIRSELGAFGERMARIEVVMQDRLPAAP